MLYRKFSWLYRKFSWLYRCANWRCREFFEVENIKDIKSFRAKKIGINISGNYSGGFLIANCPGKKCTARCLWACGSAVGGVTWKYRTLLCKVWVRSLFSLKLIEKAMYRTLLVWLSGFQMFVLFEVVINEPTFPLSHTLLATCGTLLFLWEQTPYSHKSRRVTFTLLPTPNVTTLVVWCPKNPPE